MNVRCCSRGRSFERILFCDVARCAKVVLRANFAVACGLTLSDLEAELLAARKDAAILHLGGRVQISTAFFLVFVRVAHSDNALVTTDNLRLLLLLL